MDLSERVRSMAEPVLQRHGADLVDIEVKLGKTNLVRIVADRDGGIDLDTCAVVSKELSRMLDVDDPIDGRYMLEVTSPGLTRPLQGERDFRKHLGRQVKIVLEMSQHQGTIEEVRGDVVAVRVGDDLIETSYTDIRKAVLVLPW